MTRTSFLVLGAALVAVGIALAFRAMVLMYDTTTTTRVWMLQEFAVGASLAGWGAVVALPARWLRRGIALMCFGTAGLVVAVMLQSQGMPM